MELRERAILDADSELKKSKGFVLGYVKTDGKLEIIDFFEDLTEAETHGLGFMTQLFLEQYFRGPDQWRKTKDYGPT